MIFDAGVIFHYMEDGCLLIFYLFRKTKRTLNSVHHHHQHFFFTNINKHIKHLRIRHYNKNQYGSEEQNKKKKC